MKKTLLIITLFLTLTFIITGCSSEKKEEKLLDINYRIESNETELDQYNTQDPVVAMYIKNYGSIIIELYPEKAPNTVNNFISLIKSGFYDNNTFHRLVPGFVLQGGDPTGTGTGGPDYSIKGEFSANDFKNNLNHDKWVVSMARSIDNDSAGSQFFIMLDKSEYLDGKYAAFGKVIDGFDIIEKIEQEEVVVDQESGKLQNNLTLKKAIVDLKGKVYDEPEKIKN